MRRRREVKVSLFAFQDIITAVTGVIILVTLLMALELVRAGGSAADHPPSIDPGELRRQIAALRQANRILEQQIQTRQQEALALAAASPDSVQRLLQQREKLRRRLEELRAWQEQHEQEESQLAARDRQELSRTARELRSLREQLEQLERRERLAASGRHRVYRFRAGGLARWWIVDLQPDHWLLTEVDRGGRRTGRTARFAERGDPFRQRAFRTWLADRNPAAEGFFLIGRPASIESFAQLRKLLRERSFHVGYDLLGAEQSFELITTDE